MASLIAYGQKIKTAAKMGSCPSFHDEAAQCAVSDGAPWQRLNFLPEPHGHIRTHGLFTSRDFDVSPFFAVVKPTIARGFDYHALTWAPSWAPNAQNPETQAN